MPIELGSPRFVFFFSPQGLSFTFKLNGTHSALSWPEIRHVRLERKVAVGQLILWVVMFLMAVISFAVKQYAGVSFLFLCAGGSYLTLKKWREAYLVIERSNGPPVRLFLGSPAPGSEMLNEALLANGMQAFAYYTQMNGVALTSS
jgi:hypothetical protein